MTTDTIFLMRGDFELTRVPFSPYTSEGVLQQLIAANPEILVGEQINSDDPPRWLLIQSEAGIPDSKDAGDRWAVDHLLLDQYGRPTFIEVKRSTDTRIRREVVGQMLDYAANAKLYWPQDRIRDFAARTVGGVSELEARLQEFLQSEDSQDSLVDVESYWEAVERHLRNGEVRLLFVADSIPTELRRVIEFLNEHMPSVEVLGVEIRQYKGGDVSAIVPRVVGQTEFAKQEKRAGHSVRRVLSEAEFLSKCEVRQQEFFSDLLEQARAFGYTVNWGVTGFSLRLASKSGRFCSVLYGYLSRNNGETCPVLQGYVGQFESKEAREQFYRALLGLAQFEKRGEKTLELSLDDDYVESMRALIPHMLQEGKSAVEKDAA